MLTLPTEKVLNHLLTQNSWAMRRLMPFAGKTARFDIAPFSFAYTILADGSVLSTEGSTHADITCVIAPSLLPRLALRNEAAYTEIRHNGDSALYAEIAAILRELRWDKTEDLSRITGDIAAERITQAVQITHQTLRDAATNLSQTAAEYWTEERPLVSKPQQLSTFKQQVGMLRDEVTHLEQRIAHLFNTDKS